MWVDPNEARKMTTRHSKHTKPSIAGTGPSRRTGQPSHLNCECPLPHCDPRCPRTGICCFGPSRNVTLHFAPWTNFQSWRSRASLRRAAGHRLCRRGLRFSSVLQYRRDQPGGHFAHPGHQKTAGRLPVREDLGSRRHGAAGELDSEQNRQGDQRLMHPGGVVGFCAFWTIHPQRCCSQRVKHRA